MNLIECVKEFGKIGFEIEPFSEVDSLIFSTLSYLDFSKVLKGEGFSKRFFELNKDSELLIKGAVHPKKERELLKAVANAPRYQKVKAGYFREVSDESLPVRFAACAFYLPNGEIYLAFRGTDLSLIAWKEDFDLLFLNTIPSQREGLKYLFDLSKAEKGNFYLGGHSKGGNVALYSAVFAGDKIRSRILKVFDHDGPGFHESIKKESGYLEIKSRVFKTVPHDSLVGMLMQHISEFTIVKSRSTLFGQHNPFEWEEKSLFAFSTLKSLASISKRAEIALKGWIYSMSQRERKRFVQVLFEVIFSTGAKTTDELFSHKLRNFLKMRRAYRKLSKKDRALIKEMGKILLRIWFRALKKGEKA